jgi:hypothetical protein
MMHALGGWKSCWRRPTSAVVLLAVVALSGVGCGGGDAAKPAATPSTAEPAGATTKTSSPAAKGKEGGMTAQEKRALRKKEAGD